MYDDFYEERPKEKKILKNKKIMIPLLLILTIAAITTSYALWQLTFTQTGTNVITTGCLKLTLTEETDAINLVDATPTSDEEGKKLEPFTFTLENVCTTETKYVVNLETLSSGDKILADSYVRANLVSGTNEVFIDNLLTKHVNEEKVIEESTTAYKLHQGTLGNKEKISFSLRLWMDEATEAIDEVMNATWQGKITVTATYVPPVDMRNVMVAMKSEINELPSSGYIYYENLTYTQNKKYDVRKVVYQSEMNPIEDAIETVDFSEMQDRTVLGYYVPTNEKNSYNDTIYTLYIQAEGKIKVNPVASYYGTNGLSSYVIEGIENLDTSLVTDMSYMFYGNRNAILDLSTFDTSNVTDMSHMFEMSEISELNLGLNFDTSKVRDMSYMFYECNSLTTTINITNPNVEKYERMFGVAAIWEGAQITVNYTTETSDLVDRMIATKEENSNVVKGTLIQ